MPAAEYELGQFIANHWCYPLHRRCEEARDVLKKALIAQSDRAGLALATLLSTPNLPILDYELAYLILHGYRWDGGRTAEEQDLYNRILPMISKELQRKREYVFRVDFINKNRYDRQLFIGSLLDFNTYIRPNIYVDENYRKNFPEYCGLVRRMAEDGDLMAMYFYGRMLLTYNPRYNQKADDPCLQGDGDAWLYKAIDNGLTLGVEAIEREHYYAYWTFGPDYSSDLLKLYERAYKMGDSYYAFKIAKLKPVRETLLERVYFAYAYYFSNRQAGKQDFLESPTGRGIRMDSERLSEETKQRIEREARSFEPDYP